MVRAAEREADLLNWWTVEERQQYEELGLKIIAFIVYRKTMRNRAKMRKRKGHMPWTQYAGPGG